MQGEQYRVWCVLFSLSSLASSPLCRRCQEVSRYETRITDEDLIPCCVSQSFTDMPLTYFASDVKLSVWRERFQHRLTLVQCLLLNLSKSNITVLPQILASSIMCKYYGGKLSISFWRAVISRDHSHSNQCGITFYTLLSCITLIWGCP